jgi:hypothetical protein
MCAGMMIMAVFTIGFVRPAGAVSCSNCPSGGPFCTLENCVTWGNRTYCFYMCGGQECTLDTCGQIEPNCEG